LILIVILITAVLPIQAVVSGSNSDPAQDQTVERWQDSAVNDQLKKEYDADCMNKGWTLVWSDEFDGPQIDTTKWNFVDKGDGFGNNELEYYTPRPENAYIENGSLIIKALKESYQGNSYTSAKMFTQNKGDWTYGRIEVKTKLPYGQGIWPAIWMMPTDYALYGGWPGCGEIDIMEYLGHQTGTVYGTLHYGNPWKHTGSSYTLPDGKQFCDDYHVFALEWQPGEFRWYVDGILYQTQNDWFCKDPKEALEYTYPAPFDRQFYLQLNLAVGGTWPGNPNDSTVFPQTMTVDYVRVYKYNGIYPPAGDRPAEVNPPAPLRQPLADGNLVYNGSFDQDVPEVEGIPGVANSDYWEFLTGFGGNGTASNEGGVFKATITSVGQQLYSIQLVQKPLYIQRGEIYKVSFDAKSTATRNIMMKIGEFGGGWSLYSNEETFTLGNTMKSYSFNFQMMAGSDANARLEFNLGMNSNPVYIDNVKVVKLDTSNMEAPRLPLATGNYIYNGRFDQGKNRTAFWELKRADHILGFMTVGAKPEERECYLHVLTPGKAPNALQLVQGPLNIEATETYVVKFDARAIIKDRSIQVDVGQAVPNGLSYSGFQTFNLTREMATYSFEFMMNTLTDIQAQLEFNVGGNPHDVVVDNVSIIKKRKPIAVSGFTRIEAEDYFDMFGIQTEGCVEGGRNVGWFDAGDWLKYALDVKQAGVYVLSLRVAGALAGNVGAEIEGVTATPYTASVATGGWQNWKTVSFIVPLNTGIQTLKITGNQFNINWIQIAPNIITNGTFDNGTASWGSWAANWEGASHTLSVVNGQLKVAIKYEGNEFWATQLFQNVLKIENGKNYRVSFDASATIAREIQVMVEKNGGDSAKYSGMKTFNLTPDLKNYIFEFTMTAPTDPVAHLLFGLGRISAKVGGAHTITIDNVCLSEIDELTEKPEVIVPIEGNQIKNSTFDAGMASWGYYNEWGGGASSSAGVENGELKVAITSDGNDFWHIQITQDNIQLVKGQTYIVKFDARSTVARNIQAILEQNGGSYTKYLMQTVSLTSDMTTYTYEFIMNAATDVKAHIVFALGKIGGVNVGAPHDVFLDNISVALKK
jgi:beta-glucanase (GH16 family)